MFTRSHSAPQLGHQSNFQKNIEAKNFTVQITNATKNLDQKTKKEIKIALDKLRIFIRKEETLNKSIDNLPTVIQKMADMLDKDSQEIFTQLADKMIDYAIHDKETSANLVETKKSSDFTTETDLKTKHDELRQREKALDEREQTLQEILDTIAPSMGIKQPDKSGASTSKSVTLDDYQDEEESSKPIYKKGHLGLGALHRYKSDLLPFNKINKLLNHIDKIFDETNELDTHNAPRQTEKMIKSFFDLSNIKACLSIGIDEFNLEESRYSDSKAERILAKSRDLSDNFKIYTADSPEFTTENDEIAAKIIIKEINKKLAYFNDKFFDPSYDDRAETSYLLGRVLQESVSEFRADDRKKFNSEYDKKTSNDDYKDLLFDRYQKMDSIKDHATNFEAEWDNASLSQKIKTINFAINLSKLKHSLYRQIDDMSVGKNVTEQKPDYIKSNKKEFGEELNFEECFHLYAKPEVIKDGKNFEQEMLYDICDINHTLSKLVWKIHGKAPKKYEDSQSILYDIKHDLAQQWRDYKKFFDYVKSKPILLDNNPFETLSQHKTQHEETAEKELSRQSSALSENLPQPSQTELPIADDNKPALSATTETSQTKSDHLPTQESKNAELFQSRLAELEQFPKFIKAELKSCGSYTFKKHQKMIETFDSLFKLYNSINETKRILKDEPKKTGKKNKKAPDTTTLLRESRDKLHPTFRLAIDGLKKPFDQKDLVSFNQEKEKIMDIIKDVIISYGLGKELIKDPKNIDKSLKETLPEFKKKLNHIQSCIDHLVYKEKLNVRSFKTMENLLKKTEENFANVLKSRNASIPIETYNKFIVPFEKCKNLLIKGDYDQTYPFPEKPENYHAFHILNEKCKNDLDESGYPFDELDPKLNVENMNNSEDLLRVFFNSIKDINRKFESIDLVQKYSQNDTKGIRETYLDLLTFIKKLHEDLKIVKEENPLTRSS